MVNSKRAYRCPRFLINTALRETQCEAALRIIICLTAKRIRPFNAKAVETVKAFKIQVEF